MITVHLNDFTFAIIFSERNDIFLESKFHIFSLSVFVFSQFVK